MITLTSYGAAREVTGSKHLLDTGGARVLVDCGLFQGRREEARRKNETLGFDAGSLTACINTHGHLDHCGAYPLLAKRGFRGSVWATAATCDVARLVMTDSARIQAADARFLAKQINRNARNRGAGSDGRKVFPALYDESDVEAAARLFAPVEYGRPFDVAAGVTATLRDAGHILGSAIVRFEVEDGSGTGTGTGTGRERTTVVFTGDLGRRDTPILRDPETVGSADWLVCESTYGERLHDDLALAEDELAEVVRETAAKGGRVIIPAFAIGRTQELVWHLHRLHEAGKIPPIPVYVDSPMATSATDIFRRHSECYDEQTIREFLERGDSPFTFASLKFTATAEDSKKLNGVRVPCVVIASSGMCEAGRVLHHLVAGVGDHRNTILIVGFMAEHTLGRALADKRPEVRIFGEPHAVRARVKILNAFSAHADRNELGEWVGRMDLARLEGVLLVHGEPAAQDALAAHLRGLGVRRVEAMEPGKPVVLQ
jgi:metallo-beta-lactamase family protein